MPLNFLNPRRGTPFGDLEPMPGPDALPTVAAFRACGARAVFGAVVWCIEPDGSVFWSAGGKAEVARACGADEIIFYRSEDFVARVDALMQLPRHRHTITAGALAAISRRLAATAAQLDADTAGSRVEFFTMVREA